MSTLKDRYGRTPEERAELLLAFEKANEEARDNWDDPKWHKEMAAELTETIYFGFQHENLLSLLSEVENAGFNDRVFIKEVRGLRAFWVARGGYIEASTMHAEVMELPRDTIGFHVNEFEDKLLVNFGETQATLIERGIERLDAEVNKRVLGTFQAAVPSSSPYYVSGSGVSLSSLNHALRQVRDQSYQRQVSVVGRATMTDAIIDALTDTNSFTGFLPATNEEMVRSGLLGTYRGANIVTLVNYRDDQETSFFPANEMYVVAVDASKFAFWGGLQAKEWVEEDAWEWHYMTRRDFGGAVYRPERLRRIVDTSQSA